MMEPESLKVFLRKAQFLQTRSVRFASGPANRRQEGSRPYMMLRWKRVTPLRFALGMLFFFPMFGLLLALQLGKLENLMVTSESMEPTLLTGDRVFMKRISNYSPNRGDVVVLADPDLKGDLLTKRVVALPGDVIRIVSGIVLVNGRPEMSGFLTESNTRVNWPDCKIKVPPGDVFVLGDNRNRSYDSLNFGPVHLQNLRGKLLYRYWPLERAGEIQ